MATYERLRKLFTDITLATLAAQSLGGCEKGVGKIGRGPYDLNVCGDMPLESVTPAVAVDYLAIRRVVDDGSVDGGPSNVDNETSIGTPCATATDVPACNDALESIPFGEGFEAPIYYEPGVAVRYQLVYTRGNEVGSIHTAEDLRAFLGTIENAKDAALIARFAEGRAPSCDDRPNARITEEGIEIITTYGFACGPGTARKEEILLIAPDGTAKVTRSVIVELGDPNCVIGRLTDGVAWKGSFVHQDLGGYFADMAYLEAAAVVAFERLARELEALRAPRSLVDRARASAADEARHAELIGGLARTFGATPPVVDEIAALPMRDAAAIALENAQEGCVRETYGAVVATHQAETARHPEVRAVLASIAEDETRHAALSWDVAAWLDAQLDRDTRRAVREAREEAIARFAEALAPTLPEDAMTDAGLPSEATARAFFSALESTVWARGTDRARQRERTAARMQRVTVR